MLQRESGFRITGITERIAKNLGLASLLIAGLALTIAPAKAEVLTFDEVVSRALLASYDVRLTEADVKLNKNDILRKRTDYLPNIVAHMNTEYLRDLTNDQTQVAVVNNTIIPNTTRNQTSINLATSWNVIDFGARSKAVLAAKEHHIASRFAVDQRRRDIKLAVIDKYTEALIAFKNVGNKARVLDLRRGVYVCKARLFDAGNISKTEVAEAGLASADAQTALIHAQYDYVEKLKELSEYTHDIYNVTATEIADYTDATPQTFEKIVLDRTPDHKFYDREIASKRAELKALDRQRYPQIGLYSNFYMYGFNQYRIFQSFKALRPVTISFGLSVNYPVFDQLKNYSERQRKKIEIDRLIIERDKKLWELEQSHTKTTQLAQMHGVDVENRTQLIAQHNVKAGILGRLADRNLLDRSQELSQKIEMAEQELELLKSKVQLQAHVRKLRTMAEG